jgi:hypothetical protein
MDVRVKIWWLILELAATQPIIQLPPCLIIKPYVALYGTDATIEWARRHGYTQAQINDIRKRCAI